MTFTRRPPPAEVGGWPCRLKGCRVAPRDAPVGGGGEAAAVLPSPRSESESAGGRPTFGRDTVRAGWQCRARARTGVGGGFAIAGRSPSHLHLAPAGQGGSADPRPGLVRTAGRRPRRRRRRARSRRPRSESPASCTGRAGRQCQSRPGPMSEAVRRPPARRKLQSEAPASCTVRAGRHGRSPARAGVGGAVTAGGGPQASVRVAHRRHRPGRVAWPVPGPVRWVRRVAGVGVAEVLQLLAPAAAARVRRIPGATRRSEHPCRLDPPLLLRPQCG